MLLAAAVSSVVTILLLIGQAAITTTAVAHVAAAMLALVALDACAGQVHGLRSTAGRLTPVRHTWTASAAAAPVLLASTATLPVQLSGRMLLLQTAVYAATRPLAPRLSSAPIRIALLCDDDEYRAAQEALSVHEHSRRTFVLVTRFVASGRTCVGDGPAGELLAQLPAFCAEDGVNLVLVGRAHADDPQVWTALRSSGLRAQSYATWFEQQFRRIPLIAVEPSWLPPLPPPAQSRARKAMARAGSLLVSIPLALVLAVLFPLLALAIRLDSPGPVLFRQRRVGLAGRPFDIIKLRTMRTDAEADGIQFALRGDPRITRTGRWLRRTRLDELPQVLNVLRGDMTLIGPRPERPEFVEEYCRVIPYYSSRMLVRPGITGWAQVTEGYTSSVDGTLRKLERDLFYVKHRSPLLNAVILVRTCRCVLRMTGQ